VLSLRLGNLAGIQRASRRLGKASKGLVALTGELEHGGLQKRLSGSSPVQNGPRRTPYSPWLSTPYVKVLAAAPLHDSGALQGCLHCCCFFARLWPGVCQATA
jgi:hypothetical protein